MTFSEFWSPHVVSENSVWNLRGSLVRLGSITFRRLWSPQVILLDEWAIRKHVQIRFLVTVCTVCPWAHRKFLCRVHWIKERCTDFGTSLSQFFKQTVLVEFPLTVASFHFAMNLMLLDPENLERTLLNEHIQGTCLFLWNLQVESFISQCSGLRDDPRRNAPSQNSPGEKASGRESLKKTNLECDAEFLSQLQTENV